MESVASTSSLPQPSSQDSPSPFSSSAFVRIQTPGSQKNRAKQATTKVSAQPNGSSNPCKAIGRNGLICENPQMELYCSLHEAEAKVVRTEYERCMKALKRPLPVQVTREMIEKEQDLDLLENWMRSHRERLNLVNKGRKSYSWGMRHFVAGTVRDYSVTTLNLRKLVEELEIIITMLNDRSYTLIIQSQEAEWLLIDVEKQFPPCSSKNSNDSPPQIPSQIASEEEEPDPVVATERKSRLDILEFLSFVGSHAGFISDARHSTERVRIIESICRRLITRDKVLLVKAIRSDHVHVLRFFEDESCCNLKDLKRMWSKLQATEVEEILEGIVDTFRAIRFEESGAEVEADGEGIQLLGGWIYENKESTFFPLGMSEWRHLYALCGCSGCAMRCCGTFDEWARNRRLTCVGNPPLFLFWGEDRPSDAAQIMKALDVVNCGAEDRSEVESEIRKLGGGFVSAKGKAVFVERSERGWMLLKMSIHHPQAESFITEVAKFHTVLARDRRYPDTALSFCPIPPTPSLWYSRHRSSPNKNELKRMDWSIDPDEFGTTPATILAAFDKIETLEKEQNMSFLDVYEILILDSLASPSTFTGSSNFIQFEQKVSEILLQVHGLKDKKEAFAFGEALSFKKGDLIFDLRDLKALRLEGKGKNVKVVERKSNNLKEKDDSVAFRMSRSLFR